LMVMSCDSCYDPASVACTVHSNICAGAALHHPIWQSQSLDKLFIAKHVHTWVQVLRNLICG